MNTAPLVRPVRCHLCGEAMHYAGQPQHEPELRVIVQAGDDEWTLYVHIKCWDLRMTALYKPEQGR
mgnify:FL=1